MFRFAGLRTERHPGEIRYSSHQVTVCERHIMRLFVHFGRDKPEAPWGYKAAPPSARLSTYTFYRREPADSPNPRKLLDFFALFKDDHVYLVEVSTENHNSKAVVKHRCLDCRNNGFYNGTRRERGQRFRSNCADDHNEDWRSKPLHKR